VLARRVLMVLAASGVVTALIIPATQAGATVIPENLTSGIHVTCQPGKTWKVTGSGGRQYIIRNAAWATRQCIRNSGGGAAFTVIRSRPTQAWAGFPNIYYGCEWSVCTPGSVLPERVGLIGSVTSSWHAVVPRSGQWNVAYDIWFTRDSAISEAHPATEIMVWLDTRDLYSAAGWPIVTVGRQRYYLLTWITHYDGVYWRYVQFRRVHQGTVASNLNLAQFFTVAERDGYLSARDYLDAIEAGFETCRMGAGLGTKSFSATVRSRLLMPGR
jgi:Glycosyl hydrolase family 12